MMFIVVLAVVLTSLHGVNGQTTTTTISSNKDFIFNVVNPDSFQVLIPNAPDGIAIAVDQYKSTFNIQIIPSLDDGGVVFGSVTLLRRSVATGKESKRLESTLPYAICGDQSTGFLPCLDPEFDIGEHVITAIGHSGIFGSGDVIAEASWTFTLVPTIGGIPTTAPIIIIAPIDLPTVSPISIIAPTDLPTDAPVTSPVSAPSSLPTTLQPVPSSTTPPASLQPVSSSPTTQQPSTASPTTLQPVPFITNPPSTIQPIQAPTNSPTTLQPSLTTVTSAPIAVPTPIIASDTILINTGSDIDYTAESDGRLWLADNYFTASKTNRRSINVDVIDTIDDELYRSERYERNFSYNIPLPQNGIYRAKLHFAEIFFNESGRRVFSITLEGALVEVGIDIVGLVGALRPYIIEFNVDVTDGFLDIDFTRETNNAKISAIEIDLIAPSTTVPSQPTPAPNPSTISPTNAISPVTSSPTDVVAMTDPMFEDKRINCGGSDFTDVGGDSWTSDNYFVGGSTYSTNAAIASTQDDILYQTGRNGTFYYEIPVPSGEYQIKIHMAEYVYESTDRRQFDMTVEDTSFSNLDPFFIVGQKDVAFQLFRLVVVGDGYLSVNCTNGILNRGEPILSGIEITLLTPHLAHAVAGDDYVADDLTNDGFALVPVDGSQSHTHAQARLTSFIWRKGATVISTGEQTVLNLPVGVHEITLFIEDSEGNESEDDCKVTVRGSGTPFISSLIPNVGSAAGGEDLLIIGQNFAGATGVMFGTTFFNGTDVQVLNDTAIALVTPQNNLGVQVDVTVKNINIDNSESRAASYLYVINGVEIDFNSINLTQYFYKPITVEFGPDRALYAGNSKGEIGRFIFNDDYTKIVENQITVVTTPGRNVMGICFDPLETSHTPTVYFGTAQHFHGERLNSKGSAINGKIQKISSADLQGGDMSDVAVDIVIGIPTSDLDHGINNMIFGNNGEILTLVGSNTNGGIAGASSKSGVMVENVLSASALIVNLGHPEFNGTITYDADNNGAPVTGYGPCGVEIFAHGLRNPFDLVLHSNGFLYGTDNGPNLKFGAMSTNCNGGFMNDVKQRDELNLIKRGNYYGHPNIARAQHFNDPRQCAYQGSLVQGTIESYTPPLTIMPSSTDGIIEFQSNHFAGQMRGNLILSKYKNPLFRIILTADGLSVEQGDGQKAVQDVGASKVGGNGLDVTQAPNGNLIEGRFYKDNTFYAYEPIDPPVQGEFDIKAVFPRRGHIGGGSTLDIYGNNFDLAGSDNTGNVVVTLGDNNDCTVTYVQATKIQCTIPPATDGIPGAVNVRVSLGETSKVYVKAYRYITGVPTTITERCDFSLTP